MLLLHFPPCLHLQPGFWVPATAAVGLHLKIKSREVRDVELEGKPNEIVALNRYQ